MANSSCFILKNKFGGNISRYVWFDVIRTTKRALTSHSFPFSINVWLPYHQNKSGAPWQMVKSEKRGRGQSRSLPTGRGQSIWHDQNIWPYAVVGGTTTICVSNVLTTTWWFFWPRPVHATRMWLLVWSSRQLWLTVPLTQSVM
jgi:hypothetical protein